MSMRGVAIQIMYDVNEHEGCGYSDYVDQE